MMKLSTFSFAAVATLFIFVPLSANAADPAQFSKRVPLEPVRAKAKDWSGAYVGVHGAFVGSGFSTKSNSTNPALNFNNNVINGVNNNNKNKNTSTFNGGGGGLQAGYNFQTGNIVYGVEAEATLTGGSKKKSRPGLGGVTTSGLKAEQNGRGALKGKLGYSFGSTLVYATAGVAVAPTTFTSPANGAFLASKKKVNGVGPIAGVGVEHMLTENLSLKGEVELASFGKTKAKFAAGTSNINSGDVAAKVGLNYRF
jgi:opacity protein-like surface antigen